MTSWSEKKLLPYNSSQLFDLVADIEKYPEFIPWISRARILENYENKIIAELTIKFGLITHNYVSEVKFEKDPENNIHKILVELIRGPFKHLDNKWIFEPVNNNKTMVDFEIDFTFGSMMLEKLVNPLFHKAAQKMIECFEVRAEKLYGGKE